MDCGPVFLPITDYFLGEWVSGEECVLFEDPRDPQRYERHSALCTQKHAPETVCVDGVGSVSVAQAGVPSLQKGASIMAAGSGPSG